MFDRQAFLDFLSYQATVQFNEREYIVSPPAVIDGVHTQVTVTSKLGYHLDAVKRISYRRIDLTDRVFSITRGSSRTYSELVERLRGTPVFKYRVLNGGKVECRFTTIGGADVVDDLLPALVVGDVLTVKISPTSDFYLGSFKLKIV